MSDIENTNYSAGNVVSELIQQPKLDNWVVEKLSEPFPEDKLKWLPAFGFKGEGKATPVLGYVDARTVTERLNDVVGASNWEDSYSPVTVETAEYLNSKSKDYSDLTLEQRYGGIASRFGGIECVLTVLGVSKSDVGVPSYSDQLKGAYSDSLKRAGVKFGIGEYFYRLGTQFAKFDKYNKVVEAPKLPDWAKYSDTSSKADAALQSVIEQVKNSELPSDLRFRAEQCISRVYVMGSYNFAASLVEKRVVFECLQELLNVEESNDS